ncbi:unnamed protein product [Brassica oleracea]
MNWSFRHKNYRLAITSLLEQYPNRVKIVQRDESSGEIRSEHPYPTKSASDPISWLPQAISSAYGESMTMDQAQLSRDESGLVARIRLVPFGILILYDKEVFDIAWVGVGVFVSVSADGSVRVIRSIRRLSTGALSLTLLWCALVGTSRIRGIWLPLSWTVLDIRFPALPVVELQRHQASVNAVAW